MNILAIGAVPGNVEAFCAGTLLKYREQGHNIFIALTTSGNIGSNLSVSKDELTSVRKDEQLDAAKYFDAQVRFLGFDSGLFLDTPETRRAVLTAIRWANADVILTSPPWDPHADQGMTGRLVTQVLLSSGGKLHPADLPPIHKTPQVFFWDIPAGIGFQPEVYVDISNVIDTKLNAIRAHKSNFDGLQECVNENPAEAAQVLSSYRGIQAGTACKHAEGFISHKMYAFMADPRMLP